MIELDALPFLPFEAKRVVISSAVGGADIGLIS